MNLTPNRRQCGRQSEAGMRILLVEDTVDVGEAIVARFERIGHTVDWEKDGQVADEVLEVQTYELVILDVNLPALDGFSILKRLRQRRSKIPVLVLTARSQIDDRVDALDLGADDYLVKPFDYRELEARARALLRRSAGEPTNQLACGKVTIDRGSRVVTIDGAPIDLTRRELTLLEILAARPGRIFGKDELVDQLFGFGDDPSPNAIEQYVARLRKKLAGSGAEIRTLRGLGYQIVCR
jgi:two-component system response regulator TctD